MGTALVVIGFFGGVAAIVMAIVSLVRRKTLASAKWIGVAAVGLVLFFVGGIVSPPTVPKGQPANQQQPSSSKPVEDTNASTDRDAERTSALRDYMEENFGNPNYATSWWPLITGISVSGSHVTITTSIYPDAEGKSAAIPIRGAVLGYMIRPSSASSGLKSVTVKAKDGSILVTGQTPQ